MPPEKEIFAGEGIILKRLRQESAGTIFSIINRNRHYLRQWLPFVDNTWKPEDTELFIRSVLNQDTVRRDIIFEIWYRNEFSGIIALKEVDRWNKKAEIGYWLDPDFENRGIMTRCCVALIDCAFREMYLHRIQIKVAVGNARSSRIAEKLGFRFEGIERDGEKFSDKYLSLEVYSLLKSEWKSNKKALI
jgi:ribosomal-protein-serine acetyltransferase